MQFVILGIVAFGSLLCLFGYMVWFAIYGKAQTPEQVQAVLDARAADAKALAKKCRPSPWASADNTIEFGAQVYLLHRFLHRR